MQQKNVTTVKLVDDTEEVDVTDKDYLGGEYYERPGKKKTKDKIEMNLPSTVYVSVEYKIDDTKTITVGATVPVGKKETISEAHNKLYIQCLESLTKLM